MSLAFRRAVPVGLWRDALIAAVLLLLLPGMAQAKDKRELRVMTRNLYLGSSLNSAVSAPDATAFLFAVAGIYSTVQFTDFPTRANAIADEIATHVPDIIGLQEVSNWTSFGPGAIAPSLDFLAILQQALADRGLAYSVAAVSDNANIGPVPLLFPCGGPLGACFLSFQDRDVILVNDDTADLAISNPQSGSYATQQILATPRWFALLQSRLVLDRRQARRQEVPLREHPPRDRGLPGGPGGAGAGVPRRASEGRRRGDRDGRLQLRRGRQHDDDLRGSDEVVLRRCMGHEPG